MPKNCVSPSRFSSADGVPRVSEADLAALVRAIAAGAVAAMALALVVASTIAGVRRRKAPCA